MSEKEVLKACKKVLGDKCTLALIDERSGCLQTPYRSIPYSFVQTLFAKGLNIRNIGCYNDFVNLTISW